MRVESNQPLIFALAAFGFIVASIFIFTWGRLEYLRYSNCELIELSKHQDAYFQKLLEPKNKQNVFWSYTKYNWMSREIEKAKSLAQPYKDLRCYGSYLFSALHHFNLDSTVAELISTKEYTMKNEKKLAIEKSISLIAVRLRFEFHQRAVWMKNLYVDLGKVCQMKKNLDHFLSLQNFVNGACRGPASSAEVQTKANYCQKDLDRIQMIYQRESAPMNENFAKLKSKWPFVNSDLQEILKDCQRIEHGVQIN